MRAKAMHAQAENECRVRQLAELAILGASLDPLFEGICRLAASIFGVPMANVSLIDSTHQHLVACHGLDRATCPREDAICDITIRSDDPLIIEDAWGDPRVMHNHHVLGPPFIRFYAGVPLAITPGVRLGAFCLLDTVPRRLGEDELAILQGLAAIVVGQLRHHGSRSELAGKTLALADQQAILLQAEVLAAVGGFDCAPETGAMRCSDQACRILGRRPYSLDDFLAIFDERVGRTLGRSFARLAFGGHEVDVETVLTFEGAPRHVRVHATGSGAGETCRIVGIVQDITERKQAIEALEWTASHDDLTRLLNRKGFNDRLDRALETASAGARRVALVLIDLDKFQLINDTLGHAAGDAVLIGVAERLVRSVGRDGIVGRIGGDEFGILVEHCESDGAVSSLATRLLLELRATLVHRNVDVGARASIGIALDTSGSASALFKEAELALHEAKSAGRDGFAFYDRAMRQRIDERMAILSVAREAIFGGRIEPYYQPKICLETGRIGGFEALLRWHHPTLGLSAPGAMGDAFADADLAIAVGEGMLERVTCDMAGWKRDGVAFRQVAINAAEAEFWAGRYVERLLARLDATGLTPGEFEVEVTESVFLGQASGVVASALRTLSAAGVSIALDDFGTGFASLSHLKDHPVGVIKIDRSFVCDLETGRADATIVDAITSLARSLQIVVVAEGVETRYQCDFLRARACTMGQGYYFARPMPASDVPRFVETWQPEMVPRLLAVV